ncbi:hypothetical protein R3P38DRAFT_2798694 [Favolaschia claudopus]|uniref:Uncharacterized protein n=1 Tax=Favolaschia claudopus TaxID=2862362 RepID=A0AAW0A253_9AGAR
MCPAPMHNITWLLAPIKRAFNELYRLVHFLKNIGWAYQFSSDTALNTHFAAYQKINRVGWKPGELAKNEELHKCSAGAQKGTRKIDSEVQMGVKSKDIDCGSTHDYGNIKMPLAILDESEDRLCQTGGGGVGESDLRESCSKRRARQRLVERHRKGLSKKEVAVRLTLQFRPLRGLRFCRLAWKFVSRVVKLKSHTMLVARASKMGNPWLIPLTQLTSIE